MAQCKLYYYNQVPNAGDTATANILRAHGRQTQWTSPETADVVGIGSLIDYLPLHDMRAGTKIWTTGVMHDGARARFDLREFDVLALRGRLTQNACLTSHASSTLLGDGALLITDTLRTVPKKRYKLGIVPHYVDKQYLQQFKSIVNGSRDVWLIDIQRAAPFVARDIAQCEHVVSSSLHGLVFADAVGTPNARFVLPSSEKILGNSFKFKDYYSAFGLSAPAQPQRVLPNTTVEQMMSWCRDSARPGISGIQHALRHTLTRL